MKRNRQFYNFLPPACNEISEKDTSCIKLQAASYYVSEIFYNCENSLNVEVDLLQYSLKIHDAF